jgi:Chaperone of endosialidase
MSGSQLIPTNTFATQSGNIALSLLDTNFSQVASFLNNPNNYTNYLVDSGGANAYVVTFPTGVIPSSYTAGLTVVMKVANANTGASTLNVNSLGVKNILTPSGGALSSGTLAANAIVMVVYDGTQFILVGGSTTGTSIANGTSNVIIASSNGAITAATNGTTAVTIDTSQNVGIGTTSPAQKLDVNGNIQIAASSNLYFTNGSGYSPRLSNSGSNDALSIFTNNTERARIDSSGNLLVGGTTGNGRVYVKGASATSSDWSIYCTNSTGNVAFSVRNDGYTYTGLLAVSPYNYSVTGRIAYLDSSGGFGYLASVRAAKTNIASLTDVSWIYSLNPVEFNYRKKDEENQFTDEFETEKQYGLIAEEVETVNKELCFYDNDGTLRGVGYDKLTSVLLKAIQEQQALITAQAETINALTARVVSLESK